MHTCYLCQGKNFKKRTGRVRDNPNLEIIKCTYCGLVFLSSFSHIKEEFYESSGMHEGDIDIETLIREAKWDDERRFDFFKPLIENKSILDFGCGTGGFLLRARDIAKKVEGVEPERRLQSHFLKNNLNVSPDLNNISNFFDVITLFHVLEHIPDPRSILTRLAEKLKDKGQIIIETPNANDALLQLYKSKPFSNFTYWSCHLFLFSVSTLFRLAESTCLTVNYIKQVQRYPLSNHLYWLARGKPGGHKEWSFLNSRELHDAYEKQLASIGHCDTLLASFSKEQL
ncbi:MAG: class I SAM-dependent methyltransferase [Thermodesulfobacteriota bacterium]